MAEVNNAKPCPHMARCGFAGENCTEELSTTCPVIVKPEPEPVKAWDPLEPVAITLTMEQWLIVKHALQFDEDTAKARALEFEQYTHVPDFMESAAQRKAHAKRAAGILEIISKIIGFD